MEDQARLALFADNARAAKKAFAWRNASVNRLAALLYAAEGREIDIEAVRDNLERVKRSTGMFSMFRGDSAISLAAQLSLSGDPEARLADALAVYELLKDAKFRASPYLPIAAYQIAANASPDRFGSTVARAQSFYAAMKANHRFLTGQDDYIYAAMLALSDVEVEAGTERMEWLYAALKPELRAGNALQALTQVLVLGDEGGRPEERVLALKGAFRERGFPMDRSYTLPSLGVLALLPRENRDIVEETALSFEWLREQKGFGAWSVDKQELLLHAAALVAYRSMADGVVPLSALATSLTNLIVAQQAAIAAAAATAAAASSSSSS
ncbi:DUF4003 family protein [Cohnella sp. GCM10027633]|uniref:DUF4003 family protein n=1 Tax=unclassified Cohnella TaxID=2636738 RepID=UPI00363E8585